MNETCYLIKKLEDHLDGKDHGLHVNKSRVLREILEVTKDHLHFTDEHDMWGLVNKFKTLNTYRELEGIYND